MTPLADIVGPLAEGVIIFGLAPAASLVTAMFVVGRLVDWWAGRSLVPVSRREGRQLTDGEG